MITVEQLHDAADIVAKLEGFPQDAEVMKFIEESDFPSYPQLDQASMAYGICIGIVVMGIDREGTT